jgi:phage gpG-like protein
MSDSVDVKMTGVEDVIANIHKIAIASPGAVMRGVKAVALKIERQAKLNITAQGAVDTGRLRASITTNWTGSGLSRGDVKDPVPETQPDDGVGGPQEKPDTFTAVVGTNVKYGPYIEHGHRVKAKAWTTMVEARPYLYPAYFAHEADVPKEISAELGKELAKAMKK